jgi:hypothetical protein
MNYFKEILEGKLRIVTDTVGVPLEAPLRRSYYVRQSYGKDSEATNKSGLGDNRVGRRKVG